MRSVRVGILHIFVYLLVFTRGFLYLERFFYEKVVDDVTMNVPLHVPLILRLMSVTRISNKIQYWLVLRHVVSILPSARHENRLTEV